MLEENPKIPPVLNLMDQLLDQLVLAEKQFSERLAQVDETYKSSAFNLVHYAALKDFPKKEEFELLRRWGLRGLDGLDVDVFGSVLQQRNVLARWLGKGVREGKLLSEADIHTSLKRRRERLFGSRAGAMNYMITLPEEVLENEARVHRWVHRGMDVARINASQGNPMLWRNLSSLVKEIGNQVGREVKVAVDLPGRKLRTGDVRTGRSVRKFTAKFNDFGEVHRPARIKFTHEVRQNSSRDLPVDRDFYRELRCGDEVHLWDLHGKERKIEVVEIRETEVVGVCDETFFLHDGQSLRNLRTGLHTVVQGIPPSKPGIFLAKGDQLILNRRNEFPETETDQHHEMGISDSAFWKCFEPGYEVIFDDGKLRGVVQKKEEDRLFIEITRAKNGGCKLREKKGISIPESAMEFDQLPDYDKEVMKEVLASADIVDVSFVKTAEDIRQFLREYGERLEVRNMGIIIKVETRESLKNLVDLLLAAMVYNNVGIMIARGDLGVEVGWKDLPIAQEHILQLGHAAQIPVVWATQVFENLTKKGIPTRAELTDVYNALRADCIMLNKGPYITRSMELMEDMAVATIQPTRDGSSERKLPVHST